jgi:hypothetical protein
MAPNLKEGDFFRIIVKKLKAPLLAGLSLDLLDLKQYLRLLGGGSSFHLFSICKPTETNVIS